MTRRRLDAVAERPSLRWGLIALAVALSLFSAAVIVGAAVVPYTNGHGQECQPLYRGGGTPPGGRVVMERGHDRCHLARSDRLLLIAVAANGALVCVAGAVFLGVATRAGRMPAD